MGVLNFLKRNSDFKNLSNVRKKESFVGITAYKPVFSNYNGRIYEDNKIRALINSIATDCSKAQFKVTKFKQKYEYLLNHRPSPFLTTSQFIRRVVTMLLCDNNVFLVPIKDKEETITGILPLAYSQAEVIEHKNIIYIKFKLKDNSECVFRYDEIGHLKRFNYSSEIFGDSNNSINHLLETLHINNQVTNHALKESASIRFIGKLSQPAIDDKDLIDERDIFFKTNLSKENNSQMLIYDSRYESIKEIESKPLFLDTQQKQEIDTNLANYFGVPLKAITHEFMNEYEANSYYESIIEPILIELSEAISNVLYSSNAIKNGCYVYVTANRMQFLDNKTKLEFSTGLYDRGIITGNDVCDIWNLPRYEGGDIHYIRKEYANLDDLESINKGVVKDNEDKQRI